MEICGAKYTTIRAPALFCEFFGCKKQTAILSEASYR